MTHNVTEIQLALIRLGFLAPLNDSGMSNADGKFGTTTLGAYNRFRTSHGKPPHEGMLLLSEISDDIFGEHPNWMAPPAKRSNPITDFITQAAIKAVLSQLKGRLPMFSGYKTYATAAITALMALYALLFGDLPIVGHIDPGAAILLVLQSLGLSFARVGAKTEAAKATGQQ